MAQNYSRLVNSIPRFVNEVSLAELNDNQFYIAMPFAKEIVLNPEQKKQLKERVVVKLELVYTRYRKSNTFSQKQLNKKRLKELNHLAPTLFENRFWDFELISQTNGNSPEDCNKMFHGFIVTFRPNATKNTLNIEANYLEDLVDSFVKQDSLDHDSIPAVYDIKTHYDKQVGYIHDTIWRVDTVRPPDPPDFFYLQSLYNDTTVLGAFRRNSCWKNFIVVTDVTGSMSPYSAQVFVWLKKQIHKKTANYFVFFNDGDNKLSHKKKPLETKGIYLTDNSEMKNVIKAAAKCMRNGSGGGENLENDIEAILDATKQFSDADEVILVADNMESMRDYNFINKIKKPVHIILCGAEKRINVQYLDLARLTKGSVHTFSSDVNELHTIKENEHFFIDDAEYMYHKGRFHSIYSCPFQHSVGSIKKL